MARLVNSQLSAATIIRLLKFPAMMVDYCKCNSTLAQQQRPCPSCTKRHSLENPLPLAQVMTLPAPQLAFEMILTLIEFTYVVDTVTFSYQHVHICTLIAHTALFYLLIQETVSVMKCGTNFRKSQSIQTCCEVTADYHKPQTVSRIGTQTVSTGTQTVSTGTQTVSIGTQTVSRIGTQTLEEEMCSKTRVETPQTHDDQRRESYLVIKHSHPNHFPNQQLNERQANPQRLNHQIDIPRLSHSLHRPGNQHKERNLESGFVQYPHQHHNHQEIPHQPILEKQSDKLHNEATCDGEADVGDSQASDQVQKESLLYLPVKSLENETQRRPPKKRSANYIKPYPDKSKAFVTEKETSAHSTNDADGLDCLEPCQPLRVISESSKEKGQKLNDFEDMEGKKMDKSTVLNKLLHSRTIRFAPRVRTQLYHGEDDPQRRFWDEKTRLASFSEVHAPSSGVWVTKLAAMGFYCPDNTSVLRCAYCDISVDINQFVHPNPLRLHRNTCLFVKGEASNISLEQLGQIRGHQFIKAMFGSTGDESGSIKSSDTTKRREHEQPISPVRGQGGPTCDRPQSSSAGQSSFTRPSSSELLAQYQSPPLRAPANQRAPPGHVDEGVGSVAPSISSLHHENSPLAHLTPLQSSGPGRSHGTPLPRPLEHPAHSSQTQALDPLHRTQSNGSQFLEPAVPPRHPGEPVTLQAPEPALPTFPAEPVRSQVPPPASVVEPSRPQVTETASTYQTARYISPTERETSSGPTTSDRGENSERNRTDQSNGVPSDPANQSPPSSTADPPRQVVTYTQLGIYTQEPKRPDLAIPSTRIETYAGWPHSSTHTPEEMAEAGFYYVGQNDLVRCFYCKGGLKSWAGHLRPWVEHARFYPNCPFIGQVKGQEFVDVVLELKARQNTITAEEVEDELRSRQGRTRANSEQAGIGSGNSGVGETLEGAVGGAVGGASGVEGGADDDGSDWTQLSNAADELESENQTIQNERTCKICQTNDVSILFLPCGHLVSCAQCAPALRSCAVCRQRVKGRVRVVGPRSN